MRIKRLVLKNFKGIESYTLEPNGKSLRIFGDNGTGKTSLADAMTYLLFDKDTQDKSPTNFGIKTRDESGEPIHGLEHSVEGVFDLEDGREVTLTKVYKENWVTKRGTSESRLENHTTDYYWSEEPVSASEYKKRVEEIMSEEQFKILTIVNYFPELLHWSRRRELLIQLIGSVDAEEIVDNYPSLSGYIELLDGRSREAVEKILRNKKQKLNKELENIPSRIDENQQHIKEVDGLSEARESIEDLKERKTALEDKLAEVRSGGGVSDLNVKVQEIEANKAKRENEFRTELDSELADQREKVKDLESKVDESESDLRKATRTYQSVKSELSELNRDIESLYEKIQAEQSKQPEPKDEGSDLEECPMCGQEMPDDDSNSDEQYEKYVKDFNNKKAETVKALGGSLDEAEELKSDLESQLSDAEGKGAQARSKNNQRKEAIQKAKDKLQAMKDEQPSIKDDEQFTKLENQKQALLDKITDIKYSRQSQIDELQGQITGVESLMESHQQTIQQAKTNQQYRDRIKELQEQQRKYATDLEEVEAGLNMIEEYKKAEADHITDKVNDYFEIVNWRLFEPQVNGGVKETADPMVGGVPYSEGLNTGSRIRAGLDIIETMSRLLFKKEAPVWIDNAESITQLPDSELQLLSTIVSKEDKSLRVEIEDQKIAYA